MFELTINDKVYPFRFGMGFLREINKRVEMTFDEDTGAKRNIGLYYTIIDLMDGVLETLEDVLLAANQSEHPRLQRTALDAYLEDENGGTGTQSACRARQTRTAANQISS